jgi:hypothetical protein
LIVLTPLYRGYSGRVGLNTRQEGLKVAPRGLEEWVVNAWMGEPSGFWQLFLFDILGLGQATGLGGGLHPKF